jgi:threonine dehydratase
MLKQVQEAEQVIRRFFPPTPLLFAPRLSAHLRSEVYLKLESVTPIRTFKIRGALNKINALVLAGLRGGVIAASAGNHGLAVAHASRLFGIPAVICVPETANPQKVALIAAEGARVVQHGHDYQAAFEESLRIGAIEGLTTVHAYDDPDVIAGQGTIGLELADHNFDTVLMGVGGGGLIAGVAATLKALKPHVRVIGLQLEGADSMVRSLAAGQVTTLANVSTIADGLGARKPSDLTLSLTHQHVDEVRTLADADLWPAMRFLLHEERIVAEPAGAIGTAALLKQGAKGLGRIVVVVSGANIADSFMQEILRA